MCVCGDKQLGVVRAAVTVTRVEAAGAAPVGAVRVRTVAITGAVAVVVEESRRNSRSRRSSSSNTLSRGSIYTCAGGVEAWRYEGTEEWSSKALEARYRRSDVDARRYRALEFWRHADGVVM